ncbi:hypothetical protein Tco_0672660 [Tanacetum coccineum]
MGRGPYQLVHVKSGISSWRGARVDVRTYLLGGAIDSSEANGIIRDPKLRNRHVEVYGYAFWVNQCTSDFPEVNEPGGVRVAREDDRRVTEGREDVREVSNNVEEEQRESYLDVEGIKWSPWMKLFSEYGFEAKYHLGKANVVVESWSRKKSEAKNEF